MANPLPSLHTSRSAPAMAWTWTKSSTLPPCCPRTANMCFWPDHGVSGKPCSFPPGKRTFRDCCTRFSITAVTNRKNGPLPAVVMATPGHPWVVVPSSHVPGRAPLGADRATAGAGWSPGSAGTRSRLVWCPRGFPPAASRACDPLRSAVKVGRAQRRAQCRDQTVGGFFPIGQPAGDRGQVHGDWRNRRRNRGQEVAPASG